MAINVDPSLAFTTTSVTPPQTVAFLQALVASGALSTVSLSSLTPTTPGQPTADMQAFLDAIPVAQDGDVITADYHNRAVAAIRALATLLGDPSFARVIDVTVAPVFAANAVGSSPTWNQGLGFAQAPAGNCQGWMPIDLPQGTKIQRLTVTGTRNDSVSAADVALMRLSIADSAQSPAQLADVDFTTTTGSFHLSADVQVANASGAALEQYKLVDTSSYKYFLDASVWGAHTSSAVRINAITVECTRSF